MSGIIVSEGYSSICQTPDDTDDDADDDNDDDSDDTDDDSDGGGGSDDDGEHDDGDHNDDDRDEDTKIILEFNRHTGTVTTAPCISSAIASCIAPQGKHHQASENVKMQ